MQDKKVCFVIMPFNDTTKHHTEDYWTRHFDEYLTGIIEDAGPFEARRSTPQRGNLWSQIVHNLAFAPAVVADLTDRVPNVLLELGVRYALANGTVLIAEEGTPLATDIPLEGVLFYKPGDYLTMTKFESKFKKELRGCLAAEAGPDSPVWHVLNERLVQRSPLSRIDPLLSPAQRDVRLVTEEEIRNRFLNLPKFLASLEPLSHMINVYLPGPHPNILEFRVDWEHKTLPSWLTVLFKDNGLLDDDGNPHPRWAVWSTDGDRIWLKFCDAPPPQQP